MAGGIPLIEGPSLRAVIPELTVPQFLRQRWRRHPIERALIDAPSGRSYSSADLDRLVGRVAAGLAAFGFKAGDTLLMFAPNVPEWPIAAVGAMVAGGLVSGANPLYSTADLSHQMRDAGARFVFTIPPLLGTVREAAAAAGCETLIVLGEAEGAVSFATLVACGDPEPDLISDPNAVAALPYSSGTTGLPKGVMLTHRNILANFLQLNAAHPMPPGAVMLSYLPMFHIYGLTIITLYGLAFGVSVVTLPRFEPEMFLKTVQDHRVSRLHTVPPVLQFLATHPLVDAHDLTALTWVICGAAPLGSEMENRAGQRLKCEVAQGFGMTESSGVVTVTYHGKIRRGASGQLLPATQARIVDPESGLDVARGAPGELWFRGLQAFIGYRNRPEETAATITADGWVRTGDVGFFDDDGYLYITDRLKELIKVKGFQVPPAELEALLITHPLVADAAVIGRPDARCGETPVAYVRARVGLDPREVKDWIAARVVEYKQLGDVVICDVIPKTPSGKILRRVLRAQDAQRIREGTPRAENS